MAFVAGVVGLGMSRVRVSPGGSRPLVREHRDGTLPLLAQWPAGLDCPYLARTIDMAIVAAYGFRARSCRMTVTRVALRTVVGPLIPLDLVRIGSAVAMTIDVVAGLGRGVVTRGISPDDSP